MNLLHYAKSQIKKYFGKNKKAFMGMAVSGATIATLTASATAWGYGGMIRKIDCIDGEIYDKEESVCVVDIACEESGVCDEVLEKFSEEYNLIDTATDNKLKSINRAFESSGRKNVIELVEYKIKGKEDLSKPILLSAPLELPEVLRDFQISEESQKKLLEDLNHIIPSKITSRLTSYRFISDGKGNVLAYSSSRPGGKWALMVDYYDATVKNSDEIKYSKEYWPTVVHELAHIITLSGNQIDKGFSCDTYKTAIGCSSEDSYINNFFNRFWSGKWGDINPQSPGGIAELKTRYSSNRNEFLTAYSASSPYEDIAESFMYFVLSKKIEKPKTVKEQKIAFFYEYPELVSLRKFFRARLRDKMK